MKIVDKFVDVFPCKQQVQKIKGMKLKRNHSVVTVDHECCCHCGHRHRFSTFGGKIYLLQNTCTKVNQIKTIENKRISNFKNINKITRNH